MLTPPSDRFLYDPTMTSVRRLSITAGILVLSGVAVFAQGTEPAASGASNDPFIMFGSDFDRPGVVPRSNYNIGFGHTFDFLKKDPFGDEPAFVVTGYTCKVVTVPWYTTSSIGYTWSW
jgi:hypothetical protein